MTGAEFVRQVMTALEVTTPIGLAEKMRWRRGMERTVARWLAGTSEPSFAYTIDMATRAGMFDLAGSNQTALDPSHPEAIAARYARILENQVEALTGQEELRGELREIRKELATRTRAERIAPTPSRRKA